MIKKTFPISVLVISLFILPAVVLAQGSQQGQSQGTQQQDKIQDPTIHDEETVVPQGNQIQKQVNTQNAGEDSQLNVNTQESFKTNEESQGSQSRSENARLNMSIVAEKVEELLSDEKIQGGIGQEIKEIAQNQKQSQGDIEGQLNKLESRQGLTKKIFGADRRAIKNIKQQIEQNQLRIQQLQELQNQVVNQADEAQIKELVQVLVTQNIALEEQIQAEEQVGSVFGWLLKLFN